MGKNSEIQWTHNTWNPFQGCTKVSDGCKFCYMYRDFARWDKKNPEEVTLSKDATFYKPLTWQKQLEKKGEYELCFCASWSDFFHPDADKFRAEAWKVIKATPNIIYQLLTKRIERVQECLPDDFSAENYPNVAIGASVENNKVAYKRMYHLMQLKARWIFLSMEPLLEYVPMGFVYPPKDSTVYLAPLYGYHATMANTTVQMRRIDWIILGGESGNETGKYRYRPAEAEWFEAIIAECRIAKVPVFMKQLGTHLAKKFQLDDRHGGDIEEWERISAGTLCFRQFPKEWVELCVKCRENEAVRIR